jgi:hypothetical protein
MHPFIADGWYHLHLSLIQQTTDKEDRPSR